jgi:hypothetical protein
MDVRSRFHLARTFTVYYGRGRLDEISLFDVGILESAAYTREQVEMLSSAGTLPVAYLSCLESGEHLSHHGAVKPQDYLRLRGDRVFKPEFNTWVMDPRSPNWRAVVCRVAAEVLERKAFCGLFLDTIDDAEDPFLPLEIRREVIAATSTLVSQIRAAHPEAILIQNRGFNWVLAHTAALVDGVCWESFTWPLEPGSKDSFWVAARLRWILDLKRRHGFRVMLLGCPNRSDSEAAVKALCRQHGFMYYAAPGSYEAGVNASCA